jgi:endoglucanase
MSRRQRRPTTKNQYRSGCKYRGVNMAGAEFGDDWDGWIDPSTTGNFFRWRTDAELDTDIAFWGSRGFNCFRLPFSWERLQHDLLGSFNTTYQGNLVRCVNRLTAAGFYVMPDLHNYARYATGTHSAPGVVVTNGSYVQHILGDGTLTTAHLVDVWTKITTLFKDNKRVIWNLMNEPHDFGRTCSQWIADQNDIVAAIRGAGAKQLVLYGNTRASDVTHWNSYTANQDYFTAHGLGSAGGTDQAQFDATAIVDPANNFALDMHQYEYQPTSSTSYQSFLTTVTTWARGAKRKLFLSEMGSQIDATNGATAVANVLTYLNANSDVWIGFTPWNLPTTQLTTDFYGATTESVSMPWYTAFTTANFVKP